MPIVRLVLAILLVAMVTALVVSAIPLILLVLAVMALKRAKRHSLHYHGHHGHHQMPHRRQARATVRPTPVARPRAVAQPRPTPVPTRAQAARMRSSVADLLLDLDARVAHADKPELRARYQEASRLYIEASKGLEGAEVPVRTIADQLIHAKWHLDSITSALSPAPAPTFTERIATGSAETEISYA